MTQYSVCIIGNSHAGAIRHAWENRKPAVREDFAITFFTANGRELRHLGRYKRTLATRDRDLRDRFLDSAGERRIEIDRYDAFVLAGIFFGINIPGLCATSGVFEHLRLGPVKDVVSHACFSAMIRETFEKSFSLTLAGMIRSMSDAPILLSAAPFRPEHILDDPEYRDLPQLRDPGLLEAVVRQAKDVAHQAATPVKCEVLWQPAETVALPGFTKYSLSRHSTAGGRKSIEKDRWHGNEDFGEIVLLSILRRLNELSCGQVLPEAPEPKGLVKTSQRASRARAASGRN